jgi:WD40 repeat protein
MPERADVFISYARRDGQSFAVSLRDRLTRAAPDLVLWRDLDVMEGGRDWWRQIAEALDTVRVLILVMTPGALTSRIVRKEWLYARSHGVRVYPVKAATNEQLGLGSLPKWLSRVHWYDLRHEWKKFLTHLRTPGRNPRVPFQAPDLPEGFVARPVEFGLLRSRLLTPGQSEPIAITTALEGSGGGGKTTLAAALCHDDDILDAFSDGILWIKFGQSPDLTAKLKDLHEALSDERPTFSTLEGWVNKLREVLVERNCLLVLDDVWKPEHLEPFRRGGERCGRLVTTRIMDVALEAACSTATPPVLVDEMSPDQAVAMLVARIEPRPADLNPFYSLAARLGNWPQMLELAGSALVRRIHQGDSIAGAVAWLDEAYTRKGVTAFDRRNASRRRDSVERTIEVSLDFLPNNAERARTAELGIFPENVPIPVAIAGLLWGCDPFDAEDRASFLANLALVKLDLASHCIHLHDVIRQYLHQRLDDLPSLHARLLDAWEALSREAQTVCPAASGSQPHSARVDGTAFPPLDPLSFAYFLHWLAYHLIHAGWHDTLRNLLLSFDWLYLKLIATDVNALISDFDYLADDEDLHLVQLALRLSSHVLAFDPTLLASQLHGRLCGTKTPTIAPLLQRAATAAPVLRSYIPSLPQAGGTLRQILAGHNGGVNAVAVSADGHYIVSGSEDRTVRAWDLQTGEVLHILRGHDAPVNAVAVGSPEHCIVTGSSDGTVRVWDLRTGQALRTLEGHLGPVLAVAVSGDGRHVVSGSADRTVRVWDLQSGQVLRTVDGHGSSVHAVAISRDGRQIVSGSYNGTVRVWKLASGQMLRNLEGHHFGVIGVVVTGDGRYVVSGSRDRTVRVWDLKTGRALHILIHPDSVNAVEASGDGRYVVSGAWDYAVRIWDLNSGVCLQILEAHTARVNAVGFTTDGRHVISGSSDGTLGIWDLQSGQALRPLERHHSTVFSVAISGDGRHVISGSFDGTVRVWDLRTGQALRTLEGHLGPVLAVAVSGDGRHVVSGSADGTVRVWDLQSGQVLRTLDGHGTSVCAVAISRDGRQIVSGSEGTVRIWDLDSGHFRQQNLKGQGDWVRVVGISGDGRQVVSTSQKGGMQVWDLESSGCRQAFKKYKYAFFSVTISNDGRHVVSGAADGTVWVWDLKTGRSLRTLRGHGKPVHAVVVSSDGHYIVSASGDFTVQVWDQGSGRWLATFEAGRGIWCCALAPDDRTIVAGDTSGQLHYLRLDGV